MEEQIGGKFQQRERDQELERRLEDLERDEAAVRAKRRAERKARELEQRGADPMGKAGHHRRHSQSPEGARGQDARMPSSAARVGVGVGVGGGGGACVGSHRSPSARGSHRLLSAQKKRGLSQRSFTGDDLHDSSAEEEAGSWADEEAARVMRELDIEANEIKRNIAWRKKTYGMRAITAIETHWGAILACALQEVVTASGDHLLDGAVRDGLDGPLRTP